MKKIKFTKWNTVVGKDFKEMTTKQFFSVLEKNLSTNEYNVSYENNTFFVVFDNIQYKVKLDDNIMSEYLLGNYTPITLKLKQLSEKEQKINQIENQKNMKILDKENIIIRAENGEINNDQERLVYLEYLKNNKKFSFKKVKEYFKNWISDLKITKTETIEKNRFKPFPFYSSTTEEKLFGFMRVDMYIFAAVFIGLMIFEESTGLDPLPLSYFNWFWLLLTPFAVYLPPVIIYIAKYIKNRINRLKNNIKNKELLNTKIKTLSRPLVNSLSKSISLQSIDNMLEKEISDNGTHFQDIMLREVNRLVERLPYINSQERKEIALEIKALVNEYSNSTLNLEKTNDAASLLILKKNYLSKISELEEKICVALKKDQENNTREKEQAIVEEKLSKVLGKTAYIEFANKNPQAINLGIPGSDIIDNLPESKGKVKRYGQR